MSTVRCPSFKQTSKINREPDRSKVFNPPSIPSTLMNRTFFLLHPAHCKSVPTHHLQVPMIPIGRLPKQQHFEHSVQLRNPLQHLIIRLSLLAFY